MQKGPGRRTRQGASRDDEAKSLGKVHRRVFERVRAGVATLIHIRWLCTSMSRAGMVLNLIRAACICVLPGPVSADLRPHQYGRLSAQDPCPLRKVDAGRLHRPGHQVSERPPESDECSNRRPAASCTRANVAFRVFRRE